MTKLTTNSGSAAFRSRDFRLYQMARVMAILGAEAQSVAVAWQVYQITHRALDLGYTGLALFLPGLVFILPAGHVADRYDRRAVILVCYSMQAVCTTALFWFAWHRMQNVYFIYAVLFLIGTGRAFSGPASSALLPHLVPKEHFVNAVAWGATIFQIANITGPALGGLLFTLPIHGSLNGAAVVFLFTLLTLIWFVILVGSLHVRPGRMEHRAISVEVILAGFRYVARSKLLLGSISLDLFVVLLGGAVALMPIFAHDILKTGPQGLGMLRAAPAAGALLVSVVVISRPIQRRAGALMFVCVGIYSVATIVFGLSRNLVAFPCDTYGGGSLGHGERRHPVFTTAACHACCHARTCECGELALRGASNELGEFESGLTAHWFGTVPAVVIGGVGSLLITVLWGVLFPALRKADELTPEALMPQSQ